MSADDRARFLAMVATWAVGVGYSTGLRGDVFAVLVVTVGMLAGTVTLATVGRR